MRVILLCLEIHKTFSYYLYSIYNATLLHLHELINTFTYILNVMNWIKFLNDRDIKATPSRIQLLDLLLQNHNPMQTKEIEHKWNSDVDRVTLYRTLKTLVEKNIIQKIEVNENITCYNFIDFETENSEHAHFHCNNCNKVICLHEYKNETKPLPDGFISSKTNIIIEGICKKCNSHK